MTGKKKRRLFFLFEEVKEYTYRVDEAWVFESSIGNLSVDGEHYNQERARKSQKSEKLIWKEKGIFFYYWKLWQAESWPHKDVYVLISETWEYHRITMERGTKVANEIKVVNKLNLIRIKRLSWIVQEGPM